MIEEQRLVKINKGQTVYFVKIKRIDAGGIHGWYYYSSTGKIIKTQHSNIKQQKTLKGYFPFNECTKIEVIKQC